MIVGTVATTGSPSAVTRRLLGAGRAQGARVDLLAHVATHGRLSFPSHDDPGWRTVTAEAVAQSGLVGRGGAAFPTAVKWRSVARCADRPMVVVNAMEGEPASAKDHVLLCEVPHLVLDGAQVAAEVVGAAEILICVADDDDSAAASVGRALDERQGDRIERCPMSVVRPPGRYVVGEESALVTWLDHRRGVPAFRLDKSVPLAVKNRPALVHNPETLAHVALIARHGPGWFRQVGDPRCAGFGLGDHQRGGAAAWGVRGRTRDVSRRCRRSSGAADRAVRGAPRRVRRQLG